MDITRKAISACTAFQKQTRKMRKREFCVYGFWKRTCEIGKWKFYMHDFLEAYMRNRKMEILHARLFGSVHAKSENGNSTCTQF